MSRAAAGMRRLARAWRSLPHEHRLAAMAAVGLFLTMFLPWYHETVVTARHATSATVSGWGAFSFVEAIVLLVAAGVLVLLFRLGEGRPVRLPGGEGWAISAAGILTSLLVLWRIFDKQSVSVSGPGAAISGIEWGIFCALAVAAFLAYAGKRIRARPDDATRARPDDSSSGDGEQPTEDFEPVSPVETPEPRSSRPTRRRRASTDQLTMPLEERPGD